VYYGKHIDFILTFSSQFKLSNVPLKEYFCCMQRFIPLISIIIFLKVLSLDAQVIINELDVDTPSTDTMEFIELLTDTPEQPLDDYVLVLFNGSTSGGDSSYLALDLDGFVTDVNGIFVLGGPEVSPVGDFLLFENTFQNGADAVAIYQGSSNDFPDQTLATSVNLIDALAYDTNDADDSDLLNLLGLTEQINEGENGSPSTQSIQRDTNGGYFVADPTPKALNDGSGFIFNGIGFTIESNSAAEGDTIEIVFTTQEIVNEDVSFAISLNNGGFNGDDYNGDSQITIPNGSNTSTLQIEIIDDAEDEGDEIMVITFGELPSSFIRLNDNGAIRIIDNDFTTAAWGTPLAPTFGIVESTQPAGYYDTLEGLADTELRQALQDIIADPTVVRSQTYADIIDILKDADQSPLNSNQVWLAYTEQQRPKLDFQTSGGSNVGLWNREHTYPRSRGDFDDIDLDEIADGLEVFVTTNADSLRHANSDAHGLRATDGPENSSRGNQDYGEYNGPDDTAGSWQGDVARAVMFLAIRYNELALTAGNPDNSTVGELGDLDVLLEWHSNDPPDDFEMNRNNIVYTWQFNRNPFIDQPDLADFIWGSQVGEAYANPLSTEEFDSLSTILYPNPSAGFIKIKSTVPVGEISIYTITGQLVKRELLASSTQQLDIEGCILLGWCTWMDKPVLIKYLLDK